MTCSSRVETWWLYRKVCKMNSGTDRDDQEYDAVTELWIKRHEYAFFPYDWLMVVFGNSIPLLFGEKGGWVGVVISLALFAILSVFSYQIFYRSYVNRQHFRLPSFQILCCSFLTWFGHDFPAEQLCLSAVTLSRQRLDILDFSYCPLSRVLHVTLANWQRFGFEFHLRSSPSAFRVFRVQSTMAIWLITS